MNASKKKKRPGRALTPGEKRLGIILAGYFGGIAAAALVTPFAAVVIGIMTSIPIIYASIQKRRGA